MVIATSRVSENQIRTCGRGLGFATVNANRRIAVTLCRAKGDIFASADFIHGGYAFGAGWQILLPQEASGILIVSPKFAVGSGSDEQQPAGGGHDSSSR